VIFFERGKSKIVVAWIYVGYGIFEHVDFEYGNNGVDGLFVFFFFCFFWN